MNLNYLRSGDLRKGVYWYFRLEFDKFHRPRKDRIIWPTTCWVDEFHGHDLDMWEMYSSPEAADPRERCFIFREYELTDPKPSYYLAETYEDAVDLWNRVLYVQYDLCRRCSKAEESEILLSLTL